MSLLYIERSRSVLFRPHKHQINTNATAYLLWYCYMVGVILYIFSLPAVLVMFILLPSQDVSIGESMSA